MSSFSDRLTLFFKRLRSGVRVDPVRDWLIIITASALALIAIIAWNIWTFDTVASGKSLGGAPPAVAPIFDQAALESVKNIFETRAAEEAKYVTGVYRFSDPSQ